MGRSKAQKVTDLVSVGELDAAVELARDTDGAHAALRAAGWTLDGTPIREPCACIWYERGPAAHDRLLDLPFLTQHLAVFTIGNAMRLGAGLKLGGDRSTLFLDASEFAAFGKRHHEDSPDFWLYSVDMRTLAEEAAMGRELRAVACG